jgi:excisionase family DNA binding protein
VKVLLQNQSFCTTISVEESSMNLKENIWTVGRIAAMMRVSEATVRKWIKSRALRATKNSEGYEIQRGDFNAFVNEHKTA